MKEISIVFMGTPEFAVESLSQILLHGFNVKAVVTVADKAAGRGLKVKYSPVKAFALSKELPVFQPENLKDPDFIKDLQETGANLFIIVAFRKLPEVVWRIPSLGSFNLHASLLPQYRGAAPINHAILNGESRTGVTTFFLNQGIDTGALIMSEAIEIGENETAGELHDRLSVAGADLVIQTIQAIRDEKVEPRVQEVVGGLKTAPRLFREHCFVLWGRSATEVHNHIRGLSSYPGAYSFLRSDDSGREVKLLRSEVTHLKVDRMPGEVVIAENGGMLVACNDFFIELLQIQPAGKKVMTGVDFLRGNRAGRLVFGSDVNPICC
ncbi:MAG: methionyl-tRNA formyltransferase [Lentimicrobium sp.]|jgi:methionyl-tRNA formyltransferase|nr:methionyl-tRNA formyltransferase [Lentimicrobium sp.]